MVNEFNTIITINILRDLNNRLVWTLGWVISVGVGASGG